MTNPAPTPPLLSRKVEKRAEAVITHLRAMSKDRLVYALAQVHAIMDGNEWSPDTLQDIGQVFVRIKLPLKDVTP